MIERAVVRNLRRLSDHNAHPMINKQTSTDFSAWVNLDTRQPTCDVREQSRHPLQADPPAPMVKSV